MEKVEPVQYRIVGDAIGEGLTMTVFRADITSGIDLHGVPMVVKIGEQSTYHNTFLDIVRASAWNNGQLAEITNNDGELRGYRLNLEKISPDDMLAFVHSYNQHVGDDTTQMHVYRQALAAHINHLLRREKDPLVGKTAHPPTTISYMLDPYNPGKLYCEIFEPKITGMVSWDKIQSNDFFRLMNNRQVGLPRFARELEVLAAKYGVLNRDLKPEHMFMAELQGEAKLIDYGLALLNDITTKRDVVTGTLDFMHPTLLRGEKATSATDIYALATIVYERLFGVLPRGDRYDPNDSDWHGFCIRIHKNNLINVNQELIIDGLGAVGAPDLINDVVSFKKYGGSDGLNGYEVFEMFMKQALSAQLRVIPATPTLFSFLFTGLLSTDPTERNFAQNIYTYFCADRNRISVHNGLKCYLSENQAQLERLYYELNPMGIYGNYEDTDDRIPFLAEQILLPGTTDLSQRTQQLKRSQ